MPKFYNVLNADHSRRKLLYIEWIDNKGLLYSTGNYIQHPVINYNKKNMKKNVYIYIYNNHCAAQQKLTHCKSTILQ